MLKQTIASPFKSMRKDGLKKNEIIYYLTLDRRWMNKDQAERLIKIGLEEGLLTKEKETISPTFDAASVEIPIGFKPGSEILEKRDPVEEILGRIAEKNRTEISKVTAEMNEIIRVNFDGHLSAAAASVILARKYGVPFEEYLPELKKQANSA